MKATQKELDYTEEEVEEFLHEIYGNVEICGMAFSSGQALRELDPTAFRMAKLDIEDSHNRVNSIWVCSECGEEYNDEDEADQCCTDGES